MKKKLFFILVLVIICTFSITPAIADVYTPGDNKNVTETDKKTNEQTEIDDPYQSDTSIGTLLDESAEKATVDNLKGYIDRKSTEVVGLMQYGAEPILLVFFIIAAFITVCGIFGDGSLVLKGIVGMIICGAVYSIITFAPQAMGFISGFFAP